MAPRTSQSAVARARVIPLDFKQQEGEELWPGCYIGKLLGAGSQAKVYTLVDKEGKPLNPQMTQTQTQWNERACVFSTPPEISNTISNILVKS